MSSHRAIKCDKCANGFIEGPGHGLFLCRECDGHGRILIPEEQSKYRPKIGLVGVACIIAALLGLAWLIRMVS